ncbi:MAG: hypothetical protein K0U29_02015 [Gammaproteobacteria bacterium]|nr:hypothetical protein [Gammaproteobacteria bacterium]
MFIVIPLIILLLYLGALVGILQQTASALFILGLAALILSPLYLRKELKASNALTEKYLTPGMVCSVFFLISLQLMALHLHYIDWDEFGFWGQYSKSVFIHNQLLTPQDHIIHDSYRPAGILFQYFFTRLTGFHEGVTYAAQAIFIYSPLALLTADIPWEKWINAFLISIFSILILTLLNAKLIMSGSVYMDSPVGVYFGMCIAAYYCSEKTAKNIYYLIPAICILMLLKLNMMFFVGIIIFTLLVDQFIIQRKNQKIITPAVFAILILFLSATLTQISWAAHLKHLQIAHEWGSHLKPNNLNITITKNFILKWLRNPLFTLLGLLILIGVTWRFTNTNDRKPLLVTHSCLCIGFILYSIGMLMMYLFNFGSYEAIHLASFGRYMGIYFLGWGVVIYAGICNLIKDSSIRFSSLKYISGAALLIAYICSPLIAHHSNKKYNRRIVLRKQITPIAEKVKNLTSPSSAIYTVWQHSIGLEDTILRFELIPRSYNGCSSVVAGGPYANNNLGTCDHTSPQKFLALIKNSDYLLLAHTDKRFWHDYGNLFSKSDMTPLIHYTLDGKKQQSYLFKIIKKNGKVQLRNVSE